MLLNKHILQDAHGNPQDYRLRMNDAAYLSIDDAIFKMSYQNGSFSLKFDAQSCKDIHHCSLLRDSARKSQTPYSSFTIKRTACRSWPFVHEGISLVPMLLLLFLIRANVIAWCFEHRFASRKDTAQTQKNLNVPPSPYKLVQITFESGLSQ